MSVLRIDDGATPFARQIEEKTASNRQELRAAKVSRELDIALLADANAIANVYQELVAGVEKQMALVLDITCLPKRFFFLILKLAVSDERIDTLIVAYTQPKPGRYTYEHLASDPEDVAAIPGYSMTGYSPEMLVLGLGFESLGLRHLVADYKKKKGIEVLVPFPPGQPYSRRIWQILDELRLTETQKPVHRVNALDAFGTYAKIGDLTGVAAIQTKPALAPYGPKPMSLGMCLFALRHKAPVLYTQPRIYHPDYTLGTGEKWGYCLKHGERFFF